MLNKICLFIENGERVFLNLNNGSGDFGIARHFACILIKDANAGAMLNVGILQHFVPVFFQFEFVKVAGLDRVHVFVTRHLNVGERHVDVLFGSRASEPTFK